MAMALLTGQLVTTLDTSIVNVALPRIQKDLAVSSTGLHWIVSAYLLTLGGALLLGGRLADYADAVKVLRGGLAAFGVASALGGLATDGTLLVVARGLQGLSAAIIGPTALALITVVYTEEANRRRVLSWWSAVGSVGFALGALAGGVLVQYLNWRAVFLVNVPIIAASLLLTRSLPSTGRRAARRGWWQHLDTAGAIAITLTTSSLVFLVTQITGGRPSYLVWVPGLLFLVSGVAFLQIERRSPDPLLPLGILRLRGVLWANLVVLVFGVTATSGVFLLITLFLQDELNFSPLGTGLAFLPMALVAAAVSPLIAELGRRLRSWFLLTAGLIVIAAGLGLLSRVGDQSTYLTGVLPGMVVVGVGFVPVLLATVDTATHCVAAKNRGLASGLVNTTSQVAGALGVALYVGLAKPGSLHAIEHYPDAFLVGAVLALVTAVLVVVGYPKSSAQARTEVEVPAVSVGEGE